MIIEGTFTLNSSLDFASNLLSKYCYDDSNTDMPIIVLMHGFRGSIDNISSGMMQRIANEGFFVLAAGMRGRKGASGYRDASGREIYDIYDAVNYVKKHFPVSDKVCISGYSGGGGNALAAATKFPDTFNVVVDHFGMSDYGYDQTYGWYYTNPSYQNDIVNFIGDTPESAPEKYLSRAHIFGVNNFKGEIYVFHDSEDAAVSILQSQRLEEIQGDYINGYFFYSGPGDSVRYFHDIDTSQITEPIWLPRAQAVEPQELASTGSVRVCGYIVTKDFKIFLGNLDDRTADVTYDLNENRFVVTPLSGETLVRIVNKDGLSATQVIADTTEIILMESTGRIKYFFMKDGSSFQRVKNIFVKDGVWKQVKVYQDDPNMPTSS